MEILGYKLIRNCMILKNKLNPQIGHFIEITKVKIVSIKIFKVRKIGRRIVKLFRNMNDKIHLGSEIVYRM